VHGSSTSKFLISVLGIVFVFMMGVRFFRFNRETWSMSLKEDSD
jgi:hypothetical protein